MCNSGMRIEDFGHVWLLLRNELLELGDLADFLEREDLILLVSVHRKTGRVIASIFQT